MLRKKFWKTKFRLKGEKTFLKNEILTKSLNKALGKSLFPNFQRDDFSTKNLTIFSEEKKMKKI